MNSAKLADPVDIGGVPIRNRVFLAPMSGVTDEAFRRACPRPRRRTGRVRDGRQRRTRERPRRHAAAASAIPACRSIWCSLPAARRITWPRPRDRRRRGRRHHRHQHGLPGQEGDRRLFRFGADARPRPCADADRCGGRRGRSAGHGQDAARLGRGALNAPILARRAEQAGVQNGHGPWPHALPVLPGQGRLAGDRARQGRRSRSRSSPMATSARRRMPRRSSNSPAPMPSWSAARSYGAPWIGGQIAGCRRRRTTPARARAMAQAMADYVVAHYEDMLSLYGVESGLRQARKHLGWYLDRHAPWRSADLRNDDHDVARPGRRDRRAAATRSSPRRSSSRCRTRCMNVCSASGGRRGRRRADRAQHHPPPGDHDRRRTALITFANADAEDFFRSSAAMLARKTLARFRAVRQPDPDAGRSGARAAARRSTNIASTSRRRASASRRSSTSTSRRCRNFPARSS